VIEEAGCDGIPAFANDEKDEGQAEKNIGIRPVCPRISSPPNFDDLKGS
jgi:hypothetical protein